MSTSRKLNVVTDDKSEIAELRAEFQQFRDEVRIWQDGINIWQAVTCGVVAGMCLIIGALAMSFQ